MEKKGKYRILVFPCGSEIGLEIFRSLKYSMHVELIGANSLDDHGKFLYENYIGGLPFIESERLIPELKKIIKYNLIDAIYPTMDKVIWKLKINEDLLGCKIISSPNETTEICLSKKSTYNFFLDKIKVPIVYKSVNFIDKYPVFIKPDIGYGTRDTCKANNVRELESFFEKRVEADYIIAEFLSGEEYTVDCFTDRFGKLRFSGPRVRKRVNNGISVNTIPVKDNIDLFEDMANKINNAVKFQGAWFYQTKKDCNGELTLLEIACRLGGSSALYRGMGINFALLSVYDAFGIDVEIVANEYYIELDRALDLKYRIDINYSNVYVDLDDCLIINGKLNNELVAFLYQALNNEKLIILISKHEGNLKDVLKKFRLNNLFDKIIHISKEDKKYKYVQDNDGIFIDDSFSERKEIFEKIGMPVFSPDMIEVLIA